MTGSPEEPTANRTVKWEEVAQLGMPEQIGCPDIRPLGPTVAQLLKARKVTQATLAGFLAIVKSYYEAFGRLPHEISGRLQCPDSDRSHRADRREAGRQSAVVQGEA